MGLMAVVNLKTSLIYNIMNQPNIDHVRELIIIAAGIGLVVGFIVGVLVAAAIIYTDKTRSAIDDYYNNRLS